METSALVEIEELLTRVQKLKTTDFSHAELGVNGFQDAEAVKTQVADFVIRLLELMAELGGEVNPVLAEHFLRDIRSQLDAIDAQKKQIDDMVDSGVHEPNYPAKRKKLTGAIEKIANEIQVRLHSFDTSLIVTKLGQVSADRTQLDSLVEQAKTTKGEIDTFKSEASTALEAIRNLAGRTGDEESARGFSVLKLHHSGRETAWFWAFGAASGVTVAAITWALLSEVPGATSTEIVTALFRRILVISTPAVFMRISLAKHNLERNLRIIYSHRGAVLDQYRLFEAAIGDQDVDAKNKLRLAIARLVFGDPRTGYTGEAASSEVNVNPVINLAEQLGGK